MKKNALLILAGCLLLFSTSCYYDELPPEEQIEISPDQEISFAADVLPIIAKYNCAGCHDGGQDPDLRANNAYDALVPQYVTAGDAANSVFFQRLPGKSHPPVNISLTDNELTTIEEWINRGALE
ncbi:MAG: hypothetical protein KJO90_07935 [Eudoraea sp.]|nr:hypothetical protein [Eudoraea sp.]